MMVTCLSWWISCSVCVICDGRLGWSLQNCLCMSRGGDARPWIWHNDSAPFLLRKTATCRIRSHETVVCLRFQKSCSLSWKNAAHRGPISNCNITGWGFRNIFSEITSSHPGLVNDRLFKFVLRSFSGRALSPVSDTTAVMLRAYSLLIRVKAPDDFSVI